VRVVGRSNRLAPTNIQPCHACDELPVSSFFYV
jgi:hypothetical protein